MILRLRLGFIFNVSVNPAAADTSVTSVTLCLVKNPQTYEICLVKKPQNHEI